MSKKVFILVVSSWYRNSSTGNICKCLKIDWDQRDEGKKEIYWLQDDANFLFQFFIINEALGPISPWLRDQQVLDSETKWSPTRRSLVTDFRTNWFLTRRPNGPQFRYELHGMYLVFIIMTKQTLNCPIDVNKNYFWNFFRRNDKICQQKKNLLPTLCFQIT